MNEFTYIFLVFLLLSTAVKLWLNKRQIQFVHQNKTEVPNDFKDQITLEEHQKAADYTIEKTQLGQISILVSAGFLVMLTLGGVLNYIVGNIHPLITDSLWSGVALILTVFFISNLIELPIDLYQTFKIEERFGFNRTTVSQFFKDQILQLILLAVLGGGLFYALLYIMSEMGQWWWVYAWGLTVGFTLLMTWLIPTVIAPLFNKFTPLEDEALNTRIYDLLTRCGFKSKGVFVMDGSKRSGHGNAYFTGVGNNKRIVFFDTLLESLNPDEIEAVLAHELGHFKCKHIVKHLISSTLFTFVGFAILGWIHQQTWFFDGLGMLHITNDISLLLFILVAPVFTFFFSPFGSYFQRKYEFEADHFASTMTKPEYLVQALVKLYRENASTLTPDPLYSKFHHSHPPASIRIQHLKDLENAS